MLLGDGEGEKSMVLVIFGIANELFVAAAEAPVEKLLIFSYILLKCRLYSLETARISRRVQRSLESGGLWGAVSWCWGAAVASAHRSHAVVCCMLVLSQ